MFQWSCRVLLALSRGDVICLPWAGLLDIMISSSQKQSVMPIPTTLQKIGLNDAFLSWTKEGGPVHCPSLLHSLLLLPRSSQPSSPPSSSPIPSASDLNLRPCHYKSGLSAFVLPLSPFLPNCQDNRATVLGQTQAYVVVGPWKTKSNVLGHFPSSSLCGHCPLVNRVPKWAEQGIK